MGCPLENIGIELHSLIVSSNGFFKLFFGKVRGAEIAVVRSGILPKLDGFLILLDRLPLLFLQVVDDAQIVVRVAVLAIQLDGSLKVFTGVLEALHRKLRDSGPVISLGTIRLLLQCSA